MKKKKRIADLGTQACCSVPPAKGNFREKGAYIEIHGMKTCVLMSAQINPTTLLSSDVISLDPATTAILVIFDIFGFSPQISQIWPQPSLFQVLPKNVFH